MSARTSGRVREIWIIAGRRGEFGFPQPPGVTFGSVQAGRGLRADRPFARQAGRPRAGFSPPVAPAPAARTPAPAPARRPIFPPEPGPTARCSPAPAARCPRPGQHVRVAVALERRVARVEPGARGHDHHAARHALVQVGAAQAGAAFVVQAHHVPWPMPRAPRRPDACGPARGRRSRPRARRSTGPAANAAGPPAGRSPGAGATRGRPRRPAIPPAAARPDAAGNRRSRSRPAPRCAAPACPRRS